MDNFGIPSLEELRQFNVNRPDQIEAIKQSLYDDATYLAAGQTQLQFFQTPKGQSGKTLQDTNMTAAGALPAPQSFLVQSIELYMFPSEALILTVGADTLATFMNNVYEVAKSGWLELFIGSKPYLDEAPLMKFPPRCGLSGFAALSDTTTAGAARRSVLNYVSVGGPTYELQPPILLVPTQNFIVTLNWSAAVAITADMVIYCNLGGILYRNSQ
jgi:hypothetical protein